MTTYNIRYFARSLGLKLNNAAAGRLSFQKDSPVYHLWQEVLYVQKGHKGMKVIGSSFKDIETIVDKYGEQVWGERDRSRLVAPGEYDEYTHALFWEVDREIILKVFRTLYEYREDANETITRPLPRPQTTSNPKKRKRASSLSDSSDSILGSLTNDNPTDNIDLMLTTLWIAVPQYDTQIVLSLGRLSTPKLLFNAIRKEINSTRTANEQIHDKILIVSIATPLNLGPDIEEQVDIYSRNSKSLAKFRRDLVKAWDDYRADTFMQEVICFGSVYFV